jgi:hypothetical protein
MLYNKWRLKMETNKRENEISLELDDPALIFYDIEDFPIAVDLKNKIAYDVLYNKTLKQRNEYPKINDLVKYGYLSCKRNITKEEALKIAQEIYELDLISSETFSTMIPSIDHPRLRFVEVEDVPMAYFPKKYSIHWRVFSKGLLRIWHSWPSRADMGYGSRINKEEALKLAEECENRKNKN